MLRRELRVVLRAVAQERLLRGLQLPQELGGAARPDLARGDLGVGRHERARGHDRAAADDGAVEDAGAHADEHLVLNRARVHDRAMADGALHGGGGALVCYTRCACAALCASCVTGALRLWESHMSGAHSARHAHQDHTLRACGQGSARGKHRDRRTQVR